MRISDVLFQDRPPLSSYFEGLNELGPIDAISKIAEPIFTLGSFALTVPYQLYQINETIKNMHTYKVGDPRRVLDPRVTIARRSLSALGGVMGAIGCVLGSGIFFGVGGSLKVATGVICLFTNARLFLKGCIQEKEARGNQKLLQIAQYNKLKGAVGFISSAVYIGYFALTIASGVCPPVIAIGALAMALSILCAYLEKEGTREMLYHALDIIEKNGFNKWFFGRYDKNKYPVELEIIPSFKEQYQKCAEEYALKIQKSLYHL